MTTDAWTKGPAVYTYNAEQHIHIMLRLSVIDMAITPPVLPHISYLWVVMVNVLSSASSGFIINHH